MHIKNKLISILIVSLLVIPQASLASGVKRSDAATGVKRMIAEVNGVEKSRTEKTIEEEVVCSLEKPEKPVYSAKFLASRKRGVVAKGQIFETKVYIYNSGNTTWYSADSGCNGTIVNLGTDKTRDRESDFFTNDLLWESGWQSKSRIKMTSKRVDPGRTATFTFWSRAPQEDGLFREYYTPVAEGETWMDGGLAVSDVKVGKAQIDLEKKDLLQYIQTSTNLSNIDLSGDKLIEVSISRQRMKLKIGEHLIREFPVSTGTYRTPTPYGETNIFQKQQVRVASGSPHYIMPKWMQFRSGGYGIHALPSLANDRGIFWREALNHIGTRRSHGCIRLLPKDAEFAYNFGEIGTTVRVIK